ncbi:hypothetical protein BW425_23045 [Bacillus pseudomycoides]|uniref:Uncharacterized protein n=1 Tax=Bacillus pseudomycoides TaxID=64104 RepID=A0A1Y3MG46_9BACI|nr:hypothetical protein BW425_23045 [Bacillus pseudomycoides]PEK59448.1 hypothetical protein CN590_25310 [Bacillus pseudomycoides]PEL18728.1 hypothetical protein CN608_25795 [Bacillus pseudomycoides]PGE87263.1 hypothetical protein COM55_05610 [Bacillus pseudomycoides]
MLQSFYFLPYKLLKYDSVYCIKENRNCIHPYGWITNQPKISGVIIWNDLTGSQYLRLSYSYASMHDIENGIEMVARLIKNLSV